MVIRTKHEECLGEPFYRWCKLNKYDGRIHYRLSGYWEGVPQQMKFTSDDKVDGLIMMIIQRSEIRWLEWIDGEPHFGLWYEDTYTPYIKMAQRNKS